MPLNDFRSVFLPYCLKKQEDGRYAVLNREYKPVGFWTRGMVTYADFPVLVRFKRLTAKSASLLSYNGSTDTDSIFFYDDGCFPTRSEADMTAYMKRLARLAKFQIDGTPGHEAWSK